MFTAAAAAVAAGTEVGGDCGSWFRHTSLVMVSKNLYVRRSGDVIADVSVVDVLVDKERVLAPRVGSKKKLIQYGTVL